jgi:hypothetical protein
MTYAPGQLFTRNDWNSLLGQVNDKLENPPSGTDCQPIDPIPDVELEHIWAKSDIEEVRDKMIETCPDIAFSESLILWRADFLDEIEAQLEKMWCDCGSGCLHECDNAQDDASEFFLGVVNISGCNETACDEVCNERPVYDQWGDTLSSYFSLLGDWETLFTEVCVLEDEIEDLEEEIDGLENQINGVEDQITEVCGPPENDAACDALNDQLDQLNDQLFEKQVELQEKTGERNAKASERDQKLDEAESEADASNSLGEQTNTFCNVSDIFGLIPDADVPWSNLNCDTLKLPTTQTNPAGELEPCTWDNKPRGIDRCKASWALTRKTVAETRSGGRWECVRYGFLVGFKICKEWGETCFESSSSTDPDPPSTHMLSGGYTPSGKYVAGISCRASQAFTLAFSTDCAQTICSWEFGSVTYEYGFAISYPEAYGERDCFGNAQCQED